MRQRSSSRRKADIAVRLTPEEKALVKARADAAHYPLAVYIRELALGYVPKHEIRAVTAETIRTLAGAGNALKELTKRGVLTPELEAQAQNAITKILDTIVTIRSTRHTKRADE